MATRPVVERGRGPLESRNAYLTTGQGLAAHVAGTHGRAGRARGAGHGGGEPCPAWARGVAVGGETHGRPSRETREAKASTQECVATDGRGSARPLRGAAPANRLT
ncbi:MAG: hypothetical protein OHK0015_21000 [Chloroflexi bacterium OHK40]